MYPRARIYRRIPDVAHAPFAYLGAAKSTVSSVWIV
jgi:hypothetical protein